jgi:hypothetical protein
MEVETAAPRQEVADLSERSFFSIWLFLLCLPLVWAAAYFFPPLNHDVAAILHYSERWLAGERLYVDLIDENPPLIFVMTLVPAYLAKLTGLKAPVMLVACVLSSIFVNLAICRILLIRILPRENVFFWLLMPPLATFLLIVYPALMICQREAIMLVLALPYLVHAMYRQEERPLSLPVGIFLAAMAAIGFAMKPHYLAIPVLVEGYLLLTRGYRQALRDPVPWVMGAIFVLYLVWVMIFLPDYLSHIVPIAQGFYTHVSGEGLWSSSVIPTLIGFAGCAIIIFRRHWRKPARIMLVAGIGAVLSAVLQFKGWPYHTLPSESLLILTMGWLVADAFDRNLVSGLPRYRRPAIAAIFAMLAPLYYITLDLRNTFWDQLEFRNTQAAAVMDVLKKEKVQGRVLVLSPGIYPFFPALNYAKMKMATRFMTMWIVQGAYAECMEDGRSYRPVDEMSRAELFVYRAVAEDFIRYHPDIVIVDKIAGIPRCHEKDFDYIEYFSQNPDFAEEMNHYLHAYDFDRYSLFKRIPDGLKDLPKP